MTTGTQAVSQLKFILSPILKQKGLFALALDYHFSIINYKYFYISIWAVETYLPSFTYHLTD